MAEPPEGDPSKGYGRPPKSTRFAKGRSGNPKGRPKGNKSTIPYERVLGRKVPITENGERRLVSAAEAFLLHLAKQGLSGKAAEASHTLAAIREGQAIRGRNGNNRTQRMLVIAIATGNPNMAMVRLGMARKLDPYRFTSRTVIEPWLVEAALARIGDRRLARAEQEVVMAVTRTPHKVKWPSWWEVGSPAEP